MVEFAFVKIKLGLNSNSWLGPDLNHKHFVSSGGVFLVIKIKILKKADICCSRHSFFCIISHIEPERASF